MVWVRARRDFSFQFTSYRAGDVFAVQPLVAVQMKALMAVDLAKEPAQQVEPVPRRTRRQKAPSEPVPPEPVVEPDPDPAPAVEPMTTETTSPLVQGFYARKDLRADGE